MKMFIPVDEYSDYAQIYSPESGICRKGFIIIFVETPNRIR